MLLRFGFAVTLLLALAPAALLAAAPEPCSCEYCLENLEAKCRLPDGSGVASCAALVRSGACLGLGPEAESTTMTRAAPAPGTSRERPVPVLYEPITADPGCCTVQEQIACEKLCSSPRCNPHSVCALDGSCLCLCSCLP